MDKNNLPVVPDSAELDKYKLIDSEYKTLKSLIATQPKHCLNLKDFGSINGTPIKARPEDVLKALIQYGYTTDSLKKCLRDNNVGDSTYNVYLFKAYPELSELQKFMRSRKVDVFAQKSIEPFVNPLPAEAYDTIRDDQKLSMAYIQHLNNGSRAMTNMAKIAERGYNNEKKTEMYVSVLMTGDTTLKLEDIEEMTIKDMSDLL